MKYPDGDLSLGSWLRADAVIWLQSGEGCGVSEPPRAAQPVPRPRASARVPSFSDSGSLGGRRRPLHLEFSLRSDRGSTHLQRLDAAPGQSDSNSGIATPALRCPSGALNCHGRPWCGFRPIHWSLQRAALRPPSPEEPTLRLSSETDTPAWHGGLAVLSGGSCIPPGDHRISQMRRLRPELPKPRAPGGELGTQRAPCCPPAWLRPRLEAALP